MGKRGRIQGGLRAGSSLGKEVRVKDGTKGKGRKRRKVKGGKREKGANVTNSLFYEQNYVSHVG